MSYRSPNASAAERFIAFRRSELAREAVLAHVFAYDAALSSAGTTGCALHGASLFPNAEKVTKNACPSIRVSLRSTSLIPSLLRGSPRKGPPWPFTALAASMPLAPLRSDSIRPPERGVRRRLAARAMEKQEAVSIQGHLINDRHKFVGWKTAKHFRPQSSPRSVSNFAREHRWVSFALPTLRSLEGRTIAFPHGPSDTTESPLSEGRAQVAWKGLSGMDAARAALGHGWPVAAGPWNVTGAREPRRSRGRMQGQAFLLTFFAFEKSESPSRAKPLLSATSLIGHTSRSPSPKASQARTGRPPALLHGLTAALNCKIAFTSQVPKC